jgi:hypothetical protein
LGVEILKASLWSDIFPGSSSSPLSNLNDIFAARSKVVPKKY